MDLIQIDDAGGVYIAPAITDWREIEARGIDTVIDLEGGLDMGVPTVPDGCLYIYFPIDDDGLPNLRKLDGVARLGADLVREGHRVLSHCGLGFNRSALVGGLILNRLGMPGPDVVSRLRERRPGALYNLTFAEYIASRSAPPAVLPGGARKKEERNA